MQGEDLNHEAAVLDLVNVFNYSFPTGLFSSFSLHLIRYFLHWTVEVIAIKYCQILSKALIKHINYALLSGAHIFFFLMINITSLQCVTPNFSNLIEVFQHSNEMEKSTLSL